MTDPQDNAPERIAHEIESLRGYRNRPDRKLDLTQDLARLSRTYSQAAAGLGELAGIWEELAPEDIRACSRLNKLSRGVLTITVEDASKRFFLDRALRGGLRREMIRRSHVSLRDVRVLLESPRKNGRTRE